MKGIAATVLLLGLGACAGPGGTAPSGGLMYRVPDQPTLTYTTADTTNIDIDAGAMGSFRMKGTSTATLAMAFSQGEGGVQVTATFEKLAASLSQPMGGSQTATESDIQGALVFSMDRKGKGTLISQPVLKGVVEQMANPVTLVHEFFPRLPGGPVSPGATWTDTIRYDVDTDQGGTSSTSVMAYTLRGDTVVDGTALLKVTFQGTSDVTGSGMTEGMEVIQVSTGTFTGMFLWDPARGVLVAQEASGNMTGTTEVPAAGVPPMPMTITVRSVVRLQGD